MINLLQSLLLSKCPNCKKGDVYNNVKRFSFFMIPTMHSSCPGCNYSFAREPGFFTGAMYVSYGLVVAELAISYLFTHLFFSDNVTVGIMIGAIVVLAPVNYRYSRLIWIYLFCQNK